MYYYDKDNMTIKQYYCVHNGVPFKTEAEYLDYCTEHNIPMHDIIFPMHCKYSRNDTRFPQTYQSMRKAAIGTVMCDERNLEGYYCGSQADFERMIRIYYELPDGLADRAYYNGFDNAAYGYTYTPRYTPKPFDASNACKHYAFYILSYLPDDAKLRAKRYAAHMQQLTNIRNLAPNAMIHIFAQNYTDVEYVDLPQVVYHKYADGIGAQRARNEAFKALYASDYDWGIITDDDICIEENDSGLQFFRELENNSDKFTASRADIIMPRSQLFTEFTDWDVRNAEWLSSNWVMRQTNQGQFHMAIMRNLHKYYGEAPLQKEIDPKLYEGYDDTDMFMNLTRKGYYVGWMPNLLRLIANMREDDSTVQSSRMGADYIAENLASTRRRYYGRRPNGAWNYDRLKHGDITLPRDTLGDYYSEIPSYNAKIIKDYVERELTDYKRY